jgi:hypothetical protein
MAAPFGGPLTLGAYVRWAQQQGCTIRRSAVLDDKGDALAVVMISNGDRWVTEIGTQLDEYIVPTTVARFDRRLGLKSPFLSIDAPDTDDED